MGVYEHTDYRFALRETLTERKASQPRFSFAKLAKFCRLQPTYVSAVLKGKGHFNEDQVFSSCRFLELGAHEAEYMQLLHRRNRSVVQERIAALDAQLATLRKKASTTDHYIEAEAAPDPSEYYLNPMAPVVHMCSLLGRVKRNPKALAKALEVEESVVREAIEILKRQGLHESDAALHLDPRHHLYAIHRQLMRTICSDRLYLRPKDDDYAFSATFTADAKTLGAIHKNFLKFLESTQGRVTQSESEDVYQMNFDLFRWTQT